jgi:hypothetical protein
MYSDKISTVSTAVLTTSPQMLISAHVVVQGVVLHESIFSYIWFSAGGRFVVKDFCSEGHFVGRTF